MHRVAEPSRRSPRRTTRSVSWISRWCAWIGRRRRAVIGGWFLATCLAGLGASTLTGELSGGGWYVPGSQSRQVLADTASGFVGRGPTTLTLVTRDDRHTVPEEAFSDRALQAYRYVTGLTQLRVSSASGWATSEPASRSGFVGSSGRTTVSSLGCELADGDARRDLPAIQQAIDDHFRGQELTVALVGPATVWGEVNVRSEKGLMRAELLAFPLLLVILVWLYRGVLAAGLSLVVALTCVVWTLGLLSVLARFVELSLFVQNTATMLGLGVAVDYSLLLISRFREQAATDAVVEDALSATLRTAGHTVVASGVTVCLAMSTLFLVDLAVIRSLGLGAVLVVAVAMVVNLFVLPAFLVAAAARLAPPRGRHEQQVDRGRRWRSWTHLVMRRPVTALLIGGTILGLLALPARDLSTFTPDARIVGRDSTVRVGWDAVRAEFGAGAASPIVVVVAADRPLAELANAREVFALPAAIAKQDGVVQAISATTVLRRAGAVDQPRVLTAQGRSALPRQLADQLGHYLSGDGRTMVVEVVPGDSAASAASRDLVERIRRLVATYETPGVRIAVGGETAEGIDSTRTIADRLPLVAGTMLVVIYLILMMTFRSVILPLKAIAMNAASVAATFGVLVVVFQEGLGAGLLGFDATGRVTNFVPVLMLALLFGLSTDYEVFLLSRVREEWQRTGEDRGSVASGLANTAPLISGAAILMVAVFSAFALAGVLPVQELGLGMAVAILLDATVVRLILVPASMRLLGPLNWWWPKGFGRLRSPGDGTSLAPATSSPGGDSHVV